MPTGLNWVRIKIGEVICVQGKEIYDLSFVRHGECKILADYRLDEANDMKRVGKYSQYDLFGKEAAIEEKMAP
jgi:hypothetical protein